MSTRIFVFAALAIIAVFLFVITFDLGLYPLSNPSLLLLLTSAVGLVYELRNHKTIHVNDAEIIVSYIFKPDRRIKLSAIEEWQELRYYIRSSLKQTLILFFSGGEKLIIKKDDFSKVFEDMSAYLKLHLDHLDGSEARRVKVSINIKLPSVQISKAWTNQNLLCSWWSADDAVITMKQFDLTTGGSWKYQTHSKGGRTYHEYQFVEVLPNEYISWRNLKAAGYRYSFKIHILTLQESRVEYETVFPSIEECEKFKDQYSREMSDTLARLKEELLRTNI